MIYVPDINYACYVVQNEDVIRAYEEVPRANTTISYRDYYIHSDYMYNDDVQTFSRYQENLPVCIAQSNITNDVWYRVDMPDILVMLLIFCIFVFLIPLKVVVRLFRRWQ